MIYRNKNINPVIMKFCEYALHDNTYLHKKFEIILMEFN
jgi:hypothetical protein